MRTRLEDTSDLIYIRESLVDPWTTDGSTKQERKCVRSSAPDSLEPAAPTAEKLGVGMWAIFVNSVDIGVVDPRKEDMC